MQMPGPPRPPGWIGAPEGSIRICRAPWRSGDSPLPAIRCRGTPPTSRAKPATFSAHRTRQFASKCRHPLRACKACEQTGFDALRRKARFDRCATFKTHVDFHFRQRAAEDGSTTQFFPLPTRGHNSSGKHTHSLRKDAHLSKIAGLQAVGGEAQKGGEHNAEDHDLTDHPHAFFLWRQAHFPGE
ncbi:hypothetical protein ACVINH_005843 [Rhizobium anhuiense]